MNIAEHHFFPRDWEFDYPVAVKGQGVWIWDQDGRRYLDGCAGANVTGIGHGVAEIATTMAEQAETIAFVPPAHFLNEPTLKLADRLLEMAPDGYSRVMLLSGGSEAMENAFKLARQYHVLRGSQAKYRIVSRWQGFHGNTLSADAAGGHSSRRTLYTPMLMDTSHIVPACCYRCPFNAVYPTCNIQCAADLERVIVQDGAEYISAFVAETVVGAAAAAVTPVAEYYPAIREICDHHDVLWIADEVMAGAGRCGTFLAIEQWGVLPDLVVLAKGLSSGYAPLSAILLHERVATVFEQTKTPYVGGHTYNAHPVTSRVGVAVLDYVERNNLIADVGRKGEILAAGLQEIAARCPFVGDVRGTGLMWGLEFVQDKARKTPFEPDAAVATQVIREALKHELVIYPVTGCADGRCGDGVLICPPLTISDDEIQFLLERLADTLAAVGLFAQLSAVKGGGV